MGGYRRWVVLTWSFTVCPPTWYGSIVPLWLTVILLFLATHRVTRLVTRDQIPLVKVPRDAFVERWGAPNAGPNGEKLTRLQRNVSYGGRRTNATMRSLAYLWECDWCASVWVATGLALGTHYVGHAWWWQVGLIAAAASSVTGLVAQREPE